MNTAKLETYSPEQKIGVEIYRKNESKEPIYFSKLVEEFENQISRSTINKVIDKLFDLCIIDAEWIREEKNNKWVRSLHISGGEYKKYFKMLHDQIYEE